MIVFIPSLLLTILFTLLYRWADRRAMERTAVFCITMAIMSGFVTFLSTMLLS